MAWAAIALIVIGVGLAILLLVSFGDGKHADQLAAVQTAGTIVVGTGGAAALWLTARRQQATEIGLNQVKDAHALQEQVAAQTRRYQERVAATTEADAQARRITDLYTKAADQIGSDKAPVRLAGLYALRRVAQDNPDQRQTIVDVISAYLRMPYIEPTNEPPTDDAPESEHARFETRTQERQVRLTAQRILAAHLRPGVDASQPPATFWPDIDIDLTGATLINLNFSDCHFRATQFSGAKFVGDAQFTRARFGSSARFDNAQFAHEAEFSATYFADDVVFNGTRFGGIARFANAQFTGGKFMYPGIDFSSTEFARVAVFPAAAFGARTTFDNSRFHSDAKFPRVKFDDDATFNQVCFNTNVSFFRGQFADAAMFNDAEFGGLFGFDEVSFNGRVSFDRARVRMEYVTAPYGFRLSGWRVISPEGGGWGELVPGASDGGES